jgi:hypothetical protein
VESFAEKEVVIKIVYKYFIASEPDGNTTLLSLQDIKPPSVMRSSIESLIKLPLEISQEKSLRLKKEEAKIVSINKPVQKNEDAEVVDEPTHGKDKEETKSYSEGYIKYPTYDFF